MGRATGGLLRDNNLTHLSPLPGPFPSHSTPGEVSLTPHGALHHGVSAFAVSSSRNALPPLSTQPAPSPSSKICYKVTPSLSYLHTSPLSAAVTLGPFTHLSIPSVNKLKYLLDVPYVPDTRLETRDPETSDIQLTL